MKKILSLLIIITLVTTSLSMPCSSATVKGSDFELLKALDITEGNIYEGQMDDFITRLQFAEIFARAMKFDISETDTELPFTDVKSGTYNAGIINAVYKNGFMVGYGDGNFYPNKNITGNQAVKIAVDAVNYKFMAENYGGYPHGYVKTASELGISENVAVGDFNLTYSQALVIIENMLTAPYVYYGANNPDSEYDKNNPVSLLSERHKVFLGNGVVTGISSTKLTFTEGITNGCIEIENIIYDTDIDYDVDIFLGYSVDFYYRLDSGDKTVITILPDKRNSELLIESSEIISYDGKAYTYIEGNSNKKAKIDDTADFIYNGKACLEESDIYIPENGSIEMIDNNGDGKYDVIKIINRRVFVISSYQVNSDSLFDILNPSDPINTDLSDQDRIIDIKSATGKKIDISQLSKFDVAEVAVSLDGMIVDMVVSGEQISGKIESVGEDIDGRYITIQGKKYTVSREYLDYASNVNAELKPGDTGRFYLTSQGKVAYFDMTENLSAGEYVYLIKAVVGDNDELILKALTTKNTMEKLYTREKVQIDTLKKLTAYNAKLKLDEKLYTSGKITPIVAYIEKDADGFVKYIDTPKEDDDGDNKNTLHLSAEPMSYIWHVGAKNITSTMNCRDDTIVFVVPDNHEIADDTAYNAVPVSQYFMHYSVYSGVKGYSRDKYSVFSDVVVHAGNAESGYVPERKLFLIQRIDNVLDETEGVPTYKISGIENGKYAEYYLKDESIINEIYKLGGGKTDTGIAPGDAVRFTLNNDKKILKIDKIYSGSEGKSYMEYNPQYSNIPGNITAGKVDDLTAYYKSNGDFANAFRCYLGNAFYKIDGYVRLVNPVFNLNDINVINKIDSGEISLENFEIKNVYMYNSKRKELFVPASEEEITDFVTGKAYSKVLVATNEYSPLCMVIF